MGRRRTAAPGRGGSAKRVAAWGGLLVALTAGCNALFGIDDLSYGQAPTAAGGDAGGAGPSGGRGGQAGGAGGAGGQASLCGNGQPDPGEECDDGNTVAGDRCGATCLDEHPEDCPGTPIDLGGELVVINDTTEGASATIEQVDEDAGECNGGVEYLGPELIYAITPTVAGRLMAELLASYQGHWLHLHVECGSAKPLDCAWGDTALVPDRVEAQVEAGATYYLVVDGHGHHVGYFTLSMRVASCGDGVVDEPEECDDGNAVDDGNGCGADCQVECPGAVEDPQSHHCYDESSTAVVWSSAATICTDRGPGWDLVAVSSADELAFLDGQNLAHSAWTGGHDQYVEGSFQWTNGEPWWEGVWASGQPNGGADENCVLYVPSYDPDRMGDRDCDEEHYFLCELTPGGLP